MASKSALIIVAAALSACQHVPYDQPERGVEAVNVPVVTRSDFALDVAAPGSSLPSSEAARLDSWFRSLNLGYGDTVHVDGPGAYAVRDDVARIAGQYGLLLSNGAPVTQGAIPDGSVRVVVSRARAEVPGCPNWSVPAQPNYNNRTMSNHGCSVNSNLATMVANPQDLVHGREGDAVVDAATAARGVAVYRTTPPTGKEGLKDISTSKKGN
ncbi:MAG TPA: CpaD family pilus assembly lipoprotein [Sphingomicrobium sp.]|nr:CpaD family pilus assembly lipoprotein [Sphingomicrobium sp.]